MREGGAINSLIMIINNHMSVLKSEKGGRDSRGLWEKSEKSINSYCSSITCVYSTRKHSDKLCWDWTGCYLSFWVNTSPSSSPSCSHLLIYTPMEKAMSWDGLGRHLVHKLQASWKLFWVSYSDQISTLIFQRLIGWYSGLLCQQSPGKKLIMKAIRKVKRKRLKIPQQRNHRPGSACPWTIFIQMQDSRQRR